MGPGRSFVVMLCAALALGTTTADSKRHHGRHARRLSAHGGASEAHRFAGHPHSHGHAKHHRHHKQGHRVTDDSDSLRAARRLTAGDEQGGASAPDLPAFKAFASRQEADAGASTGLLGMAERSGAAPGDSFFASAHSRVAAVRRQSLRRRAEQQREAEARSVPSAFVGAPAGGAAPLEDDGTSLNRAAEDATSALTPSASGSAGRGGLLTGTVEDGGSAAKMPDLATDNPNLSRFEEELDEAGGGAAASDAESVEGVQQALAGMQMQS